MKFFFCDVETSGLDCRLNQITQLAGIFVDESPVNTIETRVNFLLKPHHGKIIDSEALKIQGRTVEELEKDGLDNDLVYSEFVHILDKYINKFDKKDKAFFVAYNARFDEDFLRQWFIENGNKFFGSYFWFPPVDVMQMAMISLIYQRKDLPNFKLGTVAKLVLGEEQSNLHDAMADIEITRKIFDKLSTKFVQS